MEQLGFHRTDFVKFDIYALKISRDSLNFIKIRVITGTLHKYQFTYFIVSRSILFIVRHFSDKFVEKMKTHFVVSIFFYKNGTVYEITWKNMVDTEAPQMKILRMRIACWITKATDTH
jgi:hypothetical protein